MMTAENNQLDFLAGGGEMSERIRNFNWNETVLGDLDNWSPSLKAITAMLLSNRFPMLLWWGKDYICIYNDAYIPILGSKHPWALGKPVRECWSEIWEVLRPLIDKPFFERVPSWSEDLHLQIHRNYFDEETHFTIAYSPAPDPTAERGIGGVLAVVHETTNQVINQRALDTLGKISNSCIGSQTEKEVYVQSANALAENSKDFPFVIIYKIDEGGTIANIHAAAGIDVSHPELSPFESIDLKNPAGKTVNIYKAVEENSTCYFVNDGSWKDLPKGAWDKMPHHFVHVPIKSQNKRFPLAILTAGLNPYRKFDNSYQHFLQLVSDQISQGVHNALAYEEERKRAEAMEELDKAKTLFFTNISHEFRTPLTLLLGNIEEAINDKRTIPENIERMEVAHRNGMRLLKLVNTLLDFSGIESGRQDASYVSTDISAFTKNLASNFRSLIEKAGLKFILNTDTEIQPVYLDRQMWEKIVFNLLSNAFKYTLQGNISVTVSADDKHAMLKVEDTGVGIPEKELPHMFDRFHRVQNIAGRTYEGTGIGLSLVKELVNLHGGSITVESTEGMGSMFTVTIPLGKDHLHESTIRENADELKSITADSYIYELQSLINEPVHSEQVSTKKQLDELILIVDDNADMRQHLQSLLSNHYRTETAGNGKEALDKIKEHLPSLILSDIMMPVMDGIQLLKELKSKEHTLNIPVILLTARAGQESRIEGFNIGADDYLVKPFSSLELLSRINAQIQLRRKNQEAIHKIKKSEKYLQQIFMQAPLTIIVYRGENFVVEVANQSTLDMWGKTEEETIGKPFFEIAPELKEQQEPLLKYILETGNPYEGKELFAQYIRNGKPYSGYFDFIYHPLRDEGNVIIGIIAVGTEVTHSVTARNKIEEKVEERTRELRHQKEFVEHILNNAKEWIAVWNKDLTLSMINDSCAKVLGKNKEELIGKTLLEINPNIKDSQSEADFMRAFQGEQIQNPPFLSQFTGRWIQNYLTPLKDDKGNVFAVITIVHDLTDILNAQEELKKTQEHFITLFNMSPIAKSISHVSDGTVVDVNPTWEKLFGRKREDVVGKNASQIGLSSKQDSDRNKQIVQENGGSGYGLEQQFHLDEDKIIFTHTSVVTIELDGVPCYLAGYIDITDRKIAEEKIIKSAQQLSQKNAELESINKELESFNYVASHDLQEPLRKIQTFINLIKYKNASQEENDRYFEKITDASKRMAALIQAVLAYSRISRGVEEFSEVDLNQILEDVKNDFELLIQEKNATIKSNKLPSIRANALQMHQLFSNLISNSLKFSKERPVVEIIATNVTGDKIKLNGAINPNSRFIHLRFSDNGIGFDPMHKEQIFSLFQRLHGKHEFSGTGIGLAIAKKIVEHHHGFISAEAKSDEGALFNVWLPN